MSFSLFLFQRRILLLISEDLVALKERLLFYAAGYHFHLTFYLISMVLQYIPNEIVLKEKKNQFLLNQKYINILANYML